MVGILWRSCHIESRLHEKREVLRSAQSLLRRLICTYVSVVPLSCVTWYIQQRKWNNQTRYASKTINTANTDCNP